MRAEKRRAWDRGRWEGGQGGRYSRGRME